jgi:hypothetical protein
MGAHSMRKRETREVPVLGDLITRPQFAELADCGTNTLKRRLAADESAPQPQNTGGVLVKYKREEAVAWLRHGKAWRALI